MANKNFTVKNGLEVGGQEVISSSGAITSAALGGQVLGTSASPSFANITTAGYLRGPASFVIDPAAHGDDTGTVVIAGNLQVDGTQTTINSTTMTVDDLNLTLASGAANAAAANGAGINVDISGATNPSLVYGSSNDDWTFNKNLNVTGNIAATGTVDGVDIAARDAILTSTTTTAGAALPKAGGTMTGAINAGANNISNINNTSSISFLSTNGYWSGGLQRINGSGNLVNIGTISSGAITSTGSSTFGPSTFTSTSVMDINLVANPPELNFEDTSGTSGSKRARWTLDDSKFSVQGLSDDDQSLSHDFINLDLSSGSIITPKGGADNVHLGENAALTLGSAANYNTAIGKDALKVNANGSNAVAIGYQALMADQSVEESTAVGAFALTSQLSGRNHAFGFRALQDLTQGVYNTAVGGETLENVVNGGYNTAVGTFAGRFNQNGDENCLFGYKAGYDINGGDANVAVGYEAFQNATTGNYNVAIGKQAMSSAAVTGDFNIAIGRTCLQQVTSGTQNLAIGVDSLTTMNTGSYNVALGPSALRLGGGALSNNTAVGAQSGRNTTSNNNAFFGYYSGYGNTSGINTAIGHRALYTNQAGTGNVAVGNDVMYYNNGGSFNVAVGNAANQANQTGSRNVHIGQQAGEYNSGTLITAVGNQAAQGLSNNTNAGSFGTYIGAYAGREINTGQSNTFIGYASGQEVTTGGNNTIVGSYDGNGDGMDIRTTSGNAIISNGLGKPLIHTVVSSNHVAGNIDVTQDLASGNHITIASGAVVNLFGSGNAFSGVFIINDFTSTGCLALVMTGGGQISIIHQTGGGSVYQATSSPASGAIGIYLSSLGVKVKNNRGSSLNIRVLSFRTRNQQ